MTLCERKTYQFIRHFFSVNDYSPTSSEIAKGIGITSRGVVHRYLRALEQQGYISLTPKKHRNIVLASNATKRPRTVRIPLVGKIAAGSPIEAVEQQDSIDVANVFLGEDRFALRVSGDSMIEEGIHDGDIIICKKSHTADNGQIVVALVNQSEATLKRFYSEDGQRVTLVPANPRYQPIDYLPEQVEIQGIYIGLLRMA